MTAIEGYYDLLEEIRISNFRIKLYQEDPNENAELELQTNSTLQKKMDAMKAELFQKSEEADSIRTAFVFVANGVLQSFAKIESWGYHYPDLDQGMIIRGFLFGKILTDFKTALKYDGAHPIVEIYMSQEKWDYEPLKHCIKNVKNELVNSYFENKLQAIEYYEHIRTLVLEVTEPLKAQGII